MGSFELKGKRAVVTGASYGIGQSFAEELGRRGAHLVLVARSASRLEEVASKIRTESGVTVEVAPCDLIDRGQRATLVASLQAMEVDLLVNNAGFGSHGRFWELESTRELDEIELNVTALVHLCRELLPQMVVRRSGGIINVASTAAFQPTPTMATYGSTKAFVLSFSEALNVECKASGVRVMALCPGPVQTAWAANTGDDVFAASSFFMRAALPDHVAKGALDAFAAGRSSFVPGLANRVMAIGTRVVPRSLLASFAGRALSS